MAAEEISWFVVHTKPKCEHVAASLMQGLEDVETYCPRIRFQRGTKRGKVWFVEALFPSYFFARFDPTVSLRAVKHSQSVLKVVDFGGVPIPVPDAVITDIRAEMEEEEVREVKVSISEGDAVELADGAMRGLKGIVDRIHSGNERVRILLEILGRHTYVDVGTDQLVSERSARGIVASRIPKKRL